MTHIVFITREIITGPDLGDLIGIPERNVYHGWKRIHAIWFNGGVVALDLYDRPGEGGRPRLWRRLKPGDVLIVKDKQYIY
jgi:hypothetical protein